MIILLHLKIITFLKRFKDLFYLLYVKEMNIAHLGAFFVIYKRTICMLIHENADGTLVCQQKRIQYIYTIFHCVDGILGSWYIGMSMYQNVPTSLMLMLIHVNSDGTLVHWDVVFFVTYQRTIYIYMYKHIDGMLCVSKLQKIHPYRGNKATTFLILCA